MTKPPTPLRSTLSVLLLLATAWPLVPVAPARATGAAQVSQPGDLQAFQLVAPGSGWVLVDQRLYSTDADGQHWQDRTPAGAAPDAIAAATFADPQHGWLVTVSGAQAGPPAYRLFRTVDGGASWTASALDLFAADDPVALSSAVYLEFLDAAAGWLVVQQATSNAFNLGALFRTTDGGDTWTRLSIPAAGPVHFTTPQEGTLSAQPGDGRYVTHDGGATWDEQAGEAPSPAPDLSEISWATPQDGWGRQAVGQCGEDGCELRVQLVATHDGGQTWTAVPLPGGQKALTKSFAAPASAAAVTSASQSGLAINFAGHAFDACPGNPLDAGFLGAMQAWSTGSPYRVWNLYIGGTSVASCGTLTADILQQLAQQGWLFIPTWVGPQAPCSGFSRKMSMDPGTAYQQGVIEAFLAMDRAEALRLGVPYQLRTALYYDLEAYSGQWTWPCRDAVKAFISGWTATLRARGHLAGVYGSPCGSFMSDFVGIPNLPDQVWLAYWTQPFYDPNASVWNVPCVANSLWTQGQRLRQYTGGHNETWNGASFNLDSDVVAGAVSTIRGNCTPGSGQAALFVYGNFGGQCVVRGLGDYSNPAALGLPNDTLSSVRLGPNTRVQLCQHDNYQGACQDLTSSDVDLSNNAIGEDQVSSARVMAYTPSLPFRFFFPFHRVSPPVSVAVPNGDFEGGPSAWSAWSARGLNVIVPNNVLAAGGVSAHSGNWAAWMGGVHTETVTLRQTLAIPADAPLLSYWHWVKSSEVGCYYDVVSIWVNNSVAESYGLCGNTGGWVKQSVDLSAWRGQWVDLRFQLTTDTSLVSSMFIDDVSFRSGP